MAITVDRKPVTRTMIRVAPGRHIVSASAKGFIRATDTLTVNPGERVTWAPRLEPLPPQQRVEDPVPEKRVDKIDRVDNSCVDAASREDWPAARTACEKLANASDGQRRRGANARQHLRARARRSARSFRRGNVVREERGSRRRRRSVSIRAVAARREGSRARRGKSVRAISAQCDERRDRREFAAGDALDRGAGVARTERKPRDGIKKPATRATPTRSSRSATCTRRATACRSRSLKRSSGFRRRRHKAMRKRGESCRARHQVVDATEQVSVERSSRAACSLEVGDGRNLPVLR